MSRTSNIRTRSARALVSADPRIHAQSGHMIACTQRERAPEGRRRHRTVKIREWYRFSLSAVNEVGPGWSGDQGGFKMGDMALCRDLAATSGREFGFVTEPDPDCGPAAAFGGARSSMRSQVSPLAR
ncbi:hypothetical protein Ato02nite_100310 [Paractinoplanes toevensis]|uniref:Uncharacterized protein n=1 Tax=Paractinoplanes toevensis TaxID=571911 RepID=A0A919WDN7_9ACTN|nr:hypothetical protein Ato02nite_100310 [Actinoplanes toevensis]